MRTVVLEHAEDCFLDTDGVTLDAARMLEIMSAWRAKRSDAEAGIRRNAAFDPNRMVVVTADGHICYPGGAVEGNVLLFTIVPRDRL